ncbi:colanic acid biosynthesis acetyltransferase WcaB, partial [Escherichia coli]|nr:colanic acid biosynthesis acetyltransferase WcaB [Escherichia coli]
DNKSSPENGKVFQLGANDISLSDITVVSYASVGSGSAVLYTVPHNALMVGEKARAKVIK